MELKDRRPRYGKLTVFRSNSASLTFLCTKHTFACSLQAFFINDLFNHMM
ncbi:hypothetical protein T643_A0732 [Klebsiella pneumoniae MRSN 1319]|nr:hypothetical protein T643_A0732 [Klebsiella pneumoniae MRSN 1319]